MRRPPLNGVCVRSKFACGIVGLCRYTVFQETTRISKVAVVQVVLCVYVGGAWVAAGSQTLYGREIVSPQETVPFGINARPLTTKSCMMEGSLRECLPTHNVVFILDDDSYF